MKITCAISGRAFEVSDDEIKTNWPGKFDQRVLCEEEYLKLVK